MFKFREQLKIMNMIKPLLWGGDEGAESAEELDWEVHTEGEI
jgi:hypothetical protein